MRISPIFGEIFKNTQKRPNTIFAAKQLLKTTKFSNFDRKKNEVPNPGDHYDTLRQNNEKIEIRNISRPSRPVER